MVLLSQLKNKKLAVVIVNWNAEELLKNCLSSFANNNYPFELETLVVDNASTDGSVKMVRKEYPAVRIIENKENVGFAKANNIAMQTTDADYYLLLNNDTIVKDNALIRLVKFIEEHPEAGVVGPKLLNSDGTLQYSCATFPDLWAILFRESGLEARFPQNRIFGKWFLTYWDHENIRAVDSVSGACFLISKKVSDRVGGLDERFFMYTEEVDWCYRIRQEGWKIYYYPFAEVIHIMGGSDYAGSAVLEMYRSWYKFRMKHFGRLYTLIFIAIVSFFGTFRILFNYLRYILGKSGNSSLEKAVIYKKIICDYLRLYVCDLVKGY